MGSSTWSVPADLRPRGGQGSRRVTHDCPSCRGRRKAYVYRNNAVGAWRCNSCGARGRFGAGRASVERQAEMFVGGSRGPEAHPARDLTAALAGGLGRLDVDARAYVARRLPGLDVELVAARTIDAMWVDERAGGVRTLARRGYSAMFPLYSPAGSIVSVQGRFVGTLEEQGAKPSQRSIEGAVEGLATFLPLGPALEAAREMGVLVVVEGVMDTAVMLGLEARNVAALPGAGYATMLGLHLVAVGFEGKVVVAFDRDTGGRAGLLALEHSVAGAPRIEVRDGRPREAKDLAELWAADFQGPARVRRHLEEALLRPVVRFGEARLYRPGPELKRLLRDVYSEAHDERGSATRAVGWGGFCGTLTARERDFGPAGVTRVGLRRVGCGGKSCGWCRVLDWPVMAELMEKSWPADVWGLAVPVTPDGLSGLRGRLARVASRERDEARKYQRSSIGGMATLLDVARGELIVLTAGNTNMMQALGDILGSPMVRLSRDEALEHARRAFASLGERLSGMEAALLKMPAEVARDELRADPWLRRRTRWISVVGDGFGMPGAKVVRAERRRRWLARLAERPTTPSDAFRATFVERREGDERRLVGVYLTMPGAGELPRLFGADPTRARPGDPGNILLCPELLGEGGRAWLEAQARRERLTLHWPAPARAPEGVVDATGTARPGSVLRRAQLVVARWSQGRRSTE